MKRKINLALVVLSTAAIGVYAGACSSDDSSNNPGDAGPKTDATGNDGGGNDGSGNDGAPGDDSSPGNDGGGDDATSDDGGGDDGGGDGGQMTAPTKTGSVYISEVIAGSLTIGVASASFTDSSGVSVEDGGTATKVDTTTMMKGDCTETVTTITLGDASVSGAPVPKSAGVITVSGGTNDVKLTPSEDGGATYTATAADGGASVGEIWDSTNKKDLMVSAAGADVPAFMTTITAPKALTVTAPVADGGSYAFTAANDLMVTWTGGDGSDGVTFSATLSSNGGLKTTTVTCTKAASPITVDKSFINDLVGTGVTLSITAGSKKSVTAGDYAVTVSTAAPGAASGTADITSN